jgi:multiple sugar transport system permease protein
MATAADAATAARTRRPRPKGRTGARTRQALTGYAFIAPNLVVFAAFMFLPLILTFVKSTQESSGFGPSQYVGLDNYSEMVHDPVFWASLRHTVLYAVVQVPLALAAGLGLAILINRKLAGRGLFRAVYFIPTVIAAVAAGIIARWMFDENNGVINKLVGLVGIDPLPWNSSSFWAWVAVIVTTLWTSAGFNMVIYLAGLQGIPREYYDAAAVDGAGPWHQFRYITLPGLRPATFFLTIYGIIGSFQVFDLIFILTHGGPGNSTEVLGTYAYKTAFDTRERGYGAAIGVVLYLLLMAVTLVQWQYNKRRED